MQKKTVKEVVLETIEYYENNPEKRAIDSRTGLCVYHDRATGNMCAVGRHMKNAQQDYECSITMLEKNGEDVQNEDIWKEMKEEYSDISIKVWEELQIFHDRPEYWNNLGLSALGQECKEKLLSTYCQN